MKSLKDKILNKVDKITMCFLKHLIANSFRRLKSQKFLDDLYKLILYRMNCGNSADFNKSGELYVLKYINENLSKEDKIIIFDVGANVGNYAISVSKIFNEKSTIHSFEPSKNTFNRFVKNTSHIKQIVANNIGLSNKECILTLYTNKAESGLASVYKRDIAHHGLDMKISEEIKLNTIDAYCLDNAIEKIHFLKLDIEGHELEALTGGQKMISNNKIQFIQFEFGGCNIDSRTYFHDFYVLLNKMYNLYRISDGYLVEIKEYSEYNEIFVTTNYLAVLRS